MECSDGERVEEVHFIQNGVHPSLNLFNLAFWHVFRQETGMVALITDKT
ncbi:Uncharacterized protein AC499_0578 [Pseudomonas amygdali pv. lachrymans]|uniref:Uncharacterized protein n=1 Tax=Pseudomonas amygdali pv. lachrymans TaxID=53707 RepID=A0ABR5KRF5_PSEAV|nr:Uncharacterized protein AC499_0578 [Pseudomonas amygdali pv. lachrymans]RMT05939.1 hypothetical protein ALP54_102863 [Pseudomonas amygdali pv. lachrymans]